MKECKCSMRTRLVGDGCRHCNPEYYIGILERQARDDSDEIDRLRAELDALRKQEPYCVVEVDRYGEGVLVAGSLERGTHKLYAAPVPPAAVAEVHDALSELLVVYKHMFNTAYCSLDPDEGLIKKCERVLAYTTAPAAVAGVPDGVAERLRQQATTQNDGGGAEGWCRVNYGDLLALLAATPAPVAPKVPDDVARDAARYRWLRSCRVGNHTIWELCSGYAELLSEKPLDDAIDSAMLAAEQAQEGKP